MRLSSVDFPHPEGPTTVRNSPSSTERLMESSARISFPRAWNSLLTLSTERRRATILEVDLSDRGADSIQSGFAVGVHIVSSWVIEVADITGLTDEDNGGGEFKRPLTPVLGDLFNFSVGRYCEESVPFVGNDPDSAAGIECQAVRPLQEGTLR